MVHPQVDDGRLRMNFDGAENAKAETFLDAFGFKEIASPASADDASPLFLAMPDTEPHEEITDARRRKKMDPKELIALGILGSDGDNRNPDDLKLGIFIQHARLRDHPIVEQAIRIAKGEARVIFTGPVHRRSARNTGRCQPLLIGCSIGHHRVTAGTLGCFCRNRTGGGIGILSNNHILADTNKGSPGDIILQPGPADGGRRSDRTSHVATLLRHVEIGLSADSINFVDAAFAYLLDDCAYDAGVVYDPENASNRWTVGSVETLMLPGMRVKKVGRTTGFTRGVTTAVGVNNLVVRMGSATAWKLARFDKQIVIKGTEEDGRPFSDNGDSGSVIFTDEGRPMGLLFAGTNGTRGNAVGVTFANPLSTVLDSLGIDIYTDPEGDGHGSSA